MGEILNPGEFLDIQPLFAQSNVIGFRRLGGRAVGVVTNQPRHRGGTKRRGSFVFVIALRSL